jgi:pyruvate/2-oxoglutarate dehydrogenase complex dihydrolipoamide acyltransferase (E2) component
MYLVLTTEGQAIVKVELGIGNGDNVREDATSGGQATTPTPATTATTPTPAAQQVTPTPATTLPTTPTPAAGTTTDAATFLQRARTEVDQYQAEITELRTILGKDTFTDADTSRLSAIVVGWMAIDTTPITAPPEHAAIADQLTAIHADLSNVGGIIFTVISTGDTSRVQEAADTLSRAEQSLTTLDQQLTALGV